MRILASLSFLFAVSLGVASSTKTGNAALLRRAAAIDDSEVQILYTKNDVSNAIAFKLDSTFPTYCQGLPSPDDLQSIELGSKMTAVILPAPANGTPCAGTPLSPTLKGFNDLQGKYGNATFILVTQLLNLGLGKAH